MPFVTAPAVPAFGSLLVQRMTLLSLIAVFSLGCGGGDGLNRQAVSGVVTVDTNPVPNGSVTFEPLFQVGLVAEPLSRKANSLSRAPKAYRLASIALASPAMMALASAFLKAKCRVMKSCRLKKQLVPASWNSKSKREIEVKDSGSNSFEFKIDSKEK